MGKPQGNKKAMKPTANAKAIKEGQVKKNKQIKFKQTPAGKVPIINGKANGNGQQKQIPSPVQAQKKSAKIKQQDKKSPQSASPQKKKSPLSASPQQKKNQKKPKQQKNAMIKKKIEEEVNDSDADLNESDINEGISIPEDVSMEGEDSNDSSSDGETPDIFGKSLADDSDDDDEDFDDDEEEESNKGIKMFKGISVKSETKETDDDDDEEEDDSDDLNESDVSSIEDDSEDEDEDEDEEEDDDDDDEAENELGLKALLGDSLVDDENDEDFEGDDDDDDEDNDNDSEADESMEINEEKTSPTKEKNGSIVMLSEEEKAEQDKRTIFIGNVPIAVEETKLKNTFKVFGPIESIRIRGIIPDSPKTPLKVAAIKKKFHPKATAKCAFIIYKSEESVPKALSLNGEQLEGNYLRVDRANAERIMDPKKAIFLGNLPFDLEDNDLWECFKACGKVDWVRTVRDRMTGCVRGIGYINFKNEDSVALALELNGTKLRNRAIRVDRYKAPTEKKPKKSIGKKRSFSGDTQNSKSKKAKNEIETATANSQNAERRKQLKGKRSQGEQKRRQESNNDAFQGQRANNKKSFNKGNNKMQKKKQNMSAKLTSKPNKPQ